MPALVLRDGIIVQLYNLWSEERACVSFLYPDQDAIHAFREWVARLVEQEGRMLTGRQMNQV